MLTALRVVTRGGSRAVRRLTWATVTLLVLGPRVAQAQIPIDTAWRADSARRAKILDSIGGEMSRLLQMYWTIPEYHDEQRFVIAPRNYGPIVNIFASPYLGDFRHPWQIEEQGAGGMLVAVVFVDTTPNASLPPEYQELNLRPGVSCLWLSYQPGVSQPWKGSVSQATTGASGTVCRPSGPRSDLRVERTTYTTPSGPQFTIDDYPPVAFFSDATNGQPLLGVKCLDGYCEFGPSKNTWKPTPPPTTGRREEVIKGWYDEQWLDERDQAGVLRPTVRATIIPRPNINDLPASAFEPDSIQVSTIKIEAPVPKNSKYYALGLRQGSNAVYLRKKGATWRGRIVPQSAGPQSGGPPSTWRSVTPMSHVDAAVPGTARWRWTGADAGAWSPCGGKCCRI
jgi:hypothetical protein